VTTNMTRRTSTPAGHSATADRGFGGVVGRMARNPASDGQGGGRAVTGDEASVGGSDGFLRSGGVLGGVARNPVWEGQVGDRAVAGDEVGRVFSLRWSEGCGVLGGIARSPVWEGQVGDRAVAGDEASVGGSGGFLSSGRVGLGPRRGTGFIAAGGSGEPVRSGAAVAEAFRRPAATQQGKGPSSASRASSIPRLLVAGLLVVGVSAGGGAVAGRYAGDLAGVVIPQPPRPGPLPAGAPVAGPARAGSAVTSGIVGVVDRSVRICGEVVR